MSKRSFDGQRKADDGSPFKIPDKEMILTRGRTTKLKRQLRITSLQKSPEKQPQKGSKSPATKIVVRSGKMTDKNASSSCKRPNKKIILKPPQKIKSVETNLRTNNKRKSNCPKRSGAQTSPKREEKNKNVAIAHSKGETESKKRPIASLKERLLEAERTRRCSFAELIRERETSEQLTDEDLLEIVQCPSPVWWEDPPSEIYDEDPIFFTPPVKMKSTDEDISKKEELNVSRIPDSKCEPKFIAKRSLLENVLKNLKTNNNSKHKSLVKLDNKSVESHKDKKNNNNENKNSMNDGPDMRDDNKPGTSKLKPHEHMLTGSKVEIDGTQNAIFRPSTVDVRLEDLINKMHKHLPNVKCVTALTMKQKKNTTTNRETNSAELFPDQVDVIDLSDDDSQKKEIITIKDSPVPSVNDCAVEERAKLDETKVLNDLENLKIPISLHTKECIVIDEDENLNSKDPDVFLDEPGSNVTQIEEIPELESDEDNVFVMGIQNYVDISDFDIQNNEVISLKTDSEMDVLSLETQSDELMCVDPETDEDFKDAQKEATVQELNVINPEFDDEIETSNKRIRSDIESILEENGIAIIETPRDNDSVKRNTSKESKLSDTQNEEKQLDKRKYGLDHENLPQCSKVVEPSAAHYAGTDIKINNVVLKLENSCDAIGAKRKSLDELKNPKVKIIRIEHDKRIIQPNKFEIGNNCEESIVSNDCEKESKVVTKIDVDSTEIKSTLPDDFGVTSDLKLRLDSTDNVHKSNQTNNENNSQTNLKAPVSKIRLAYKELIAKIKTKIKSKKEAEDSAKSSNRDKLINLHVVSKSLDKSESQGQFSKVRVSPKNKVTNLIEKNNVKPKTDCSSLLSRGAATSEAELLQSSEKKNYEETETYSDDEENHYEDVSQITMTKEMIDSIIGIGNSTNLTGPEALEQIVLHGVNQGLVSQEEVDLAQKENFKYCFKCSSIYETAECMYCIKPTVVAKTVEAKVYSCNICQYKSKKRCFMDAHSCHAKDKPYSCDNCQNTFKTKATLRSHIRRYCRMNSTDVPMLKSETIMTGPIVNQEHRSNITDDSQEEVETINDYVNSPEQKQILDENSGYLVILTES